MIWCGFFSDGYENCEEQPVSPVPRRITIATRSLVTSIAKKVLCGQIIIVALTDRTAEEFCWCTNFTYDKSYNNIVCA